LKPAPRSSARFSRPSFSRYFFAKIVVFWKYFCQRFAKFCPFCQILATFKPNFCHI
jgi:hypothetical protein